MWDWGSEECFQELKTISQPRSLPSECAIFDCAFDATGTRLITCEVDKTIKLWCEYKDLDLCWMIRTIVSPVEMSVV
jgi:pleiotropic regulator 1